MKYKFLEHTADVKFRGFGKTYEELFGNSALALKETISQDKINSKLKKEIRVEDKDLEDLLYSFLEEFLVFFDNEGFVLSEIKELKIKKIRDKYSLKSVVLGDSVDSGEKDYEISNHVKAITYNEMFVKKEKGRWISQIVVDV